MKLLDKPIRVDKPATFNFSIDKDGWQMISVSARAKSEKQREYATDDEDLRVEIDNLTFPSLSDSQRLFDSPAAFSGGKLKNILR